MKSQVTLLAACLLSAGIANAQNTMNGSSSNTNSTYSTSPAQTDSSGKTNSTYATSPATMSSDSMSKGNTNSTYSTNSTAQPAYGTTTTNYTTDNQNVKEKKEKGYKNFVFGVYAGLNSTRFKGEGVDGNNLSGRVGYQAGFFVRGGGRLFGQLGGEYFASSSNYFRKGDGQSVQNISDQIDIQYIQIPVYIGYKIFQSERGISAVRLQAGVEYANRINSKSNSFNLSNSEIKSGTFNGLGQLGFDIGPLLIDLTYHYGFDNSVNAISSTGFAGSQRRIVSASVGFKF